MAYLAHTSLGICGSGLANGIVVSIGAFLALAGAVVCSGSWEVLDLKPHGFACFPCMR